MVNRDEVCIEKVLEALREATPTHARDVLAAALGVVCGEHDLSIDEALETIRLAASGGRYIGEAN
jgi:hypothetical protein